MPDTSPDPFDLNRFLREQAHDYEQALEELRQGHKKTHWIWYIPPQLRGLGSSEMSDYYGISGLEEARAYLAHPVLGRRLVECVRAISAHGTRQPSSILGSLDAMKYQSCLTLFDQASGGGAEFISALNLHFEGKQDQRTLELLRHP